MRNVHRRQVRRGNAIAAVPTTIAHRADTDYQQATSGWPRFAWRTGETLAFGVLRRLHPIMPVVYIRARYGEDRPEAAVCRGIDQYVIVGAGYETTAVRRTDRAIRTPVRPFGIRRRVR